MMEGLAEVGGDQEDQAEGVGEGEDEGGAENAEGDFEEVFVKEFADEAAGTFGVDPERVGIFDEKHGLHGAEGGGGEDADDEGEQFQEAEPLGEAEEHVAEVEAGDGEQPGGAAEDVEGPVGELDAEEADEVLRFGIGDIPGALGRLEMEEGDEEQDRETKEQEPPAGPAAAARFLEFWGVLFSFAFTFRHVQKSGAFCQLTVLPRPIYGGW